MTWIRILALIIWARSPELLKTLCQQVPMHSPNIEQWRRPSEVVMASSLYRFSTAGQPFPAAPVLVVMNLSPLRAWAAADLVLSKRLLLGRRVKEAKRLSSWETCLIWEEVFLNKDDRNDEDLLLISKVFLANSDNSGSSWWSAPWTLWTATESSRMSSVIST